MQGFVVSPEPLPLIYGGKHKMEKTEYGVQISPQLSVVTIAPMSIVACNSQVFLHSTLSREGFLGQHLCIAPQWTISPHGVILLSSIWYLCLSQHEMRCL